jgi:DNA (cytosine-5)-methyltransferase 1
VSAYYNEIDPYCVEWLRNLIREGLIADGEVDERSICDVQASDVAGYTQAHFFAGIGGWSLALRYAMFPDDRPVWTGSCPCQPFSAAGKGKASGDERHLWPIWFELISAVRPPVIFGEQVEAAIGWGWLDLVHTDLEAEGYTVGAAVLPACSVGAPHIRQRLWFVGNANGGDACTEGLQRSWQQRCEPQDSSVGELADRAAERWREERPHDRGFIARDRTQEIAAGLEPSRCASELANADPARCGEGRTGKAGNGRDTPRLEPTGFCADGIMGNTDISGSQGWSLDAGKHASQCSPWSPSSLIWLPCTDGKQRPTGIASAARRECGVADSECDGGIAKTRN